MAFVTGSSSLGVSSFAGSARVCPQSGVARVVRTPGTRRVVSMGLVPLVPNWLLLGSYGYMAYRFAKGFDSTTYDKSYKIVLAIFWPLLFAVNGSFRKNFLTAVKK